MAKFGKYCGKKPKPMDYADQKSADAGAFHTPKKRPSPAKGGNPINPKVPNRKAGVYK